MVGASKTGDKHVHAETNVPDSGSGIGDGIHLLVVICHSTPAVLAEPLPILVVHQRHTSGRNLAVKGDLFHVIKTTAGRIGFQRCLDLARSCISSAFWAALSIIG